jgi:putative transcriptional regulator
VRDHFPLRQILTRPWLAASVVLMVCVGCGLLLAPLAGAPNPEEPELRYLVARSGLGDPYFYHSIVLMLPGTDDSLVVGLIVNRPTRVTLGELFPNNRTLKGNTTKVFFGGPVDVREVSVVFRSVQAPKQAVRLSGGLYLSFDAELIMSLLQDSRPHRDLRFFLGRAQWSPGQLLGEMAVGAWYDVHAKSDVIFSPNPEHSWLILLQGARPTNIVDNGSPFSCPSIPRA